jgi:hypothetical protein
MKSANMKPQPVASTQEVLAGLVERVTYHNAENGFCDDVGLAANLLRNCRYQCMVFADGSLDPIAPFAVRSFKDV